MRPSTVLHSWLLSNLRLVPDVQVSSGKQPRDGSLCKQKVRLVPEQDLHCLARCSALVGGSSRRVEPQK